MKQIKLRKAGASAPVFLCDEANARHRIYIDNHSQSEVTLQLSYEEQGRNPVWITSPVGKLNSDFACEEFGVSAVRLQALNTVNGNVDVELTVHSVDC